jgi:hypothetical protein
MAVAVRLYGDASYRVTIIAAISTLYAAALALYDYALYL